MQGEHVDDDPGADHISVVEESLVVCDLELDADRDQAPDADRDMAPDADHINEAPDQISVITDVPDHISVITEAPSLHDVQEADGLPPFMPINANALIPPMPKKMPKQKKAAEPKPPQPPKGATTQMADGQGCETSTTAQDATTRTADGQSWCEGSWR